MDRLVGGREGDVLVGGSASETDVNTLLDILKDWDTSGPYDERVSAVEAALGVIDDGEADEMTGAAGRDVFFANLNDDLLTDIHANEMVL